MKAKNIPCRGTRADGSPCPKKFSSYSGRLWHEENKHNLFFNKENDISPDPEPESLPVTPSETEEPTGMVPRTEPISSAFPTRESITKTIAEKTAEYVEGGLVWLMVKSLAATLTLIGDEDYLKALEPVEKELKQQCARAIAPEYMARVPPAGQVIIYVIIAWLPLIFMDIKNYIYFFKGMFKSDKKKKSNDEIIDVKVKDK